MPRSLLDLVTHHNETKSGVIRQALRECIKEKINQNGWHAVIPHLHWLLR